MEKENHAFSNLPVIQINTPIKRLGLSRKRKSNGPGCSPSAKIQAQNEKLSVSPFNSKKLHLENQELTAAEDTKECDNPTINYDEEIEKLKKQISEDEEKLKTLKCNENNINQLEDLIELWKNGCKNAFLHFSQLLKERQSENIDFKAVLSRLGIWETMVENFESDSEILLSEYSQ